MNNAGFGAYGYIHEIPAERMLEMIQVNCSALVHLTRLYIAGMVQRHHGDILILASTAAFQAVPFNSVYAATKAFDLLFAEGHCRGNAAIRSSRLRSVSGLNGHRIPASGGAAGSGFSFGRNRGKGCARRARSLGGGQEPRDFRRDESLNDGIGAIGAQELCCENGREDDAALDLVIGWSAFNPFKGNGLS